MAFLFICTHVFFSSKWHVALQDSVYRLYAFFYAFIAESVSCYIDWRKVGSWVKLIFCFLQQSFSSHVTWSVFSENNFWILLLLALQHLHVFLLLYCITSSVACGFVLLGNICSLNAKCRTCLNRHTNRNCVTCHLRKMGSWVRPMSCGFLNNHFSHSLPFWLEAFVQFRSFELASVYMALLAECNLAHSSWYHCFLWLCIWLVQDFCIGSMLIFVHCFRAILQYWSMEDDFSSAFNVSTTECIELSLVYIPFVV